MARDWERWLDDYPEISTVVGAAGRNDRWTDDSLEGIDQRKRHLADSRREFGRFRRPELSAPDRTQFDLYGGLLETATEGLRFGFDPLPFRFGMPRNLWMPLNQMDGLHISISEQIELQPRSSVRDYEAILARLAAIPSAVDQHLALLRAGLEKGYSPPRAAIQGVPGQIRGLVSSDPTTSPLLHPFLDFPAGVGEDERRRLTESATRTYSERVEPAVRRFQEYVDREYLPACREEIGASALPDGVAMYSYLVRWQTTTTLSAREIHEIGLREVRRLREEIEAIRTSTGFTGDFRAFNEFLRTDRRFFFERPEQLVDGYRMLTKRIDPALPRLFGRLPRLPYGVLPVPDFRAPSSPAAYYQVGAPASGRPGYFFANTFEMRARPRWEMEALACHEAVPGHHLQLALAQELEDLPTFRLFSAYTAFVEGWGLYAESLGGELGLYTDPHSRVGQLTFDTWRSIRLVVDTGMHALGWSREQAIDFFRQNTGKSEIDIRVEVDRYIVWPGQALAYKIGQLKFRELRNLAAQRLDDEFDVRAFHDVVLGEGALPLAAVEGRVREWVASRSGGRARPQRPPGRQRPARKARK